MAALIIIALSALWVLALAIVIVAYAVAPDEEDM